MTVNLTAADVLDLSSTGNGLLVMGGAGDAVNAGAGWTQGLATLLVDADIARTITA